ncbi:MAG TPA: MFS transporter [Candidatus Bathyarchaeia archaeon]|nr:MFS transporter [Candidatus Bathyarchaeia archaeon]
MFDEYKDMPREAKYLIYAPTLIYLALGMFYFDISYFLESVQGIPAALVGIVISIMGISTFIFSIPLGIAADRYGRKKLLILGNVIASSIIAIFALTTNPAILVAAAFFEGVSEGAFSASASALLAEKAGDVRRTSVFSMAGFVQSIAFGIGSFMVPVSLVFGIFGFTVKESHVLLYVILAALSGASTLLIVRISESKGLKKAGASIRELLPSKSKDVLIKYVFTGAIIAFGAGMVVPLMSMWFGLQYGISDAISVPILGISNIVIGFATLFAPPLARKIGLVRAIVLTQGISTIFMFATPLSPEFISASFVYTVRAFLMNMASPLQQSMIMGLVPEDERGAASGISAALWRLPNALSTSIGAWLMGIGFLATPFYLASILYIVSITLFWYYFRSTKMPEELTDKR